MSTSGGSRYNLRSRQSSPASDVSAEVQRLAGVSAKNSPASDVSAEVQRLAGVSARNRVKALRMVNHTSSQPLNLFSSDED